MRARTTLRSPWRIPAAAAAVVTTAIHVSQFGSTWQENAFAGTGFAALAVVCAAGAVALAVRDTLVTWLAMAGACAAAAAGYVFSRTIGLPGMPDDIGNWTEPAGIAAITSQAIVVAAAAIAIRRGHLTVRGCPGRPVSLDG
jgi:hypothetical protein